MLIPISGTTTTKTSPAMIPYSMCKTIPCIMYSSGSPSPTYFDQNSAVGGGESSPRVIMNTVMTTVAISPPTSPLSTVSSAMCWSSVLHNPLIVGYV
jgi:hypothetical protein